jgi:hypothetical protein
MMTSDPGISMLYAIYPGDNSPAEQECPNVQGTGIFTALFTKCFNRLINATFVVFYDGCAAFV